MGKQIYTYRFPKGEFDALNECCIEYPKIKDFWDNENKNSYPFAEYTSDLIDQLNSIVKNNDKKLAAIKGTGIIGQLSNFHFTKELELYQILNWCPNDERMLMLLRYMDRLTDEEYWKQLKESYTTQDYVSIPYEELEYMFLAERSFKENIMDKDEKKLLDSLPELVTVYRAMSIEEAKSGKYRLSWTLDMKVAEKFEERNKMNYDSQMTITKLEIPKKDIIAVFLDRSEQEVIYIQ
ncbi:hypothetical protein F8C76_10240 [Flagellimonas olearia]|uniref:Uncharacterized protein n=1 Tax=Flagellimonas olearia TaxID=552546 RepID=A0A6I1DWP0_9FLAO|nr:hypothetical protein [Allomuricauda olearia]KAB7528241.1 hypothetical protein F8C76_10240 [Allomuricauda olearia]